ncbi:MAG: UDP-N-acetylmuramoyl-L-alanyl-D-glutamate synthetase [Candidatus Woesebacteria bacterium GW2011_GWC2_45_9]|uniref:UDP-N-acetylmuramoylalanine--D-glutamate ligase n=1 Tax=Candidatus Woesebacteria bacterium GW2011_GWC2_45_9 TaxID=1618589 RepID=A0A0G1NAE6_9BACT|nr:MAG: UDP-N-acetylmuramoyl-L-alanyl-D-glutamate synthetase [Candidatus Woesebacteria bacterium GW2011_GWC2_45_9]
MKNKIAILGFGLEGKDALDYFLAKGANVSIFDKKEEKELELGNIDTKVELFIGPKYDLKLLKNFDVVVRSPGVYRYLPGIKEAEEAGAEITSAVKIFFQECRGRIIGVTGTKGKGTTASLIYQILKEGKKDVYLAGNIGIPYLSLLAKTKKTSIVVLEVSSFQLIDMEVSPQVAVVLNITSDHLDWHKNLKEYVESKRNIVKFQKKSDDAVINADYEIPKSFAKSTKANVVFFSRLVPTNGAFAASGEIFLGGESLGKTHWLSLRGEHNLENVTAAISAANVFRVDIETIKKAVFSFKGLEHRLELVNSVGGVAFYNDSFATGPQPTIAAVNSFTEPLTVILGGYDKKLDYEQLGEVISKKKNMVLVVLIGQVAEKIKKALTTANFKGKILELGKASMEKIVYEAFSNTPKGGVVLLSPAAASFDMFPNYKERGKKFKEAALALGK